MAKAKKTHPWDRVFPDTPAGAKEALAAISNHKARDVARATVEPDPWIQGVWKLTFTESSTGIGVEAIVYLKGYPDSVGRIREDNDHEEVYFDEREDEDDGRQRRRRTDDWA